jgi:hypothetical protein
MNDSILFQLTNLRLAMLCELQHEPNNLPIQNEMFSRVDNLINQRIAYLNNHTVQNEIDTLYVTLEIP